MSYYVLDQIYCYKIRVWCVELCCCLLMACGKSKKIDSI
jgi:hypothetical protein